MTWCWNDLIFCLPDEFCFRKRGKNDIFFFFFWGGGLLYLLIELTMYTIITNHIFYSYCEIYMAQNEWPDVEILQQGAVLGQLK